MKKALFAWALVAMPIFCSSTMLAQNPYEKYYENLPIEIEKVQPVIFPDTTVNLKVYLKQLEGWKMGDLCTEAIQRGIDELSKAGGGHFVIPRGTWVTGPIQLKSNIDLHLVKGAKLLMTSDRREYIKPDKKGNIPSKCNPGIMAKNVKNVGITGEGVIDGQGIYWRPIKEKKLFKNNNDPADHQAWEDVQTLGGTLVQDDKTYRIWFPYNIKDFDGNPIPDICNNAKDQEGMRNNLVDFTGGENVLIQGVTITNSPKFHLVPRQIHNLIIDNVTIWCPWWAQNGDAMDIGNCRTVLVVNTKLNCGDDGICMKAGGGQKGKDLGPNTDFLITNDTVYRAHGGFVIGSEFSGGMEKMIVKNCYFEGTDIGLRFKSAPGRGGSCKDIYIYDIVMRDIKEDAIFFESGYADKRAGGRSATEGDQKDAFFPDWGNMVIRNVVAANVRNFVNATGTKDMPVHDILIENMKIYGLQKEPLKMTNCVNWTFRDCSYSGSNLDNSLKDCSNIIYNGSKLSK